MLFLLISFFCTLSSAEIISYCANGTVLGPVDPGSFNQNARWYVVTANVSIATTTTQIVFWQPFDFCCGGGPIVGELLKSIDQYVEIFPTVSLKLVNVDWGGVASGEINCDDSTSGSSDNNACPDVILIGTTQVASRYAAGELLDLSLFLSQLAGETGFVLNDDFVKYTFYDYFLGGSWYGVPFVADLRILVWNRTTFDSFGLMYPPPYGDWSLPWGHSWTWPVFAEYTSKIKSGGIFPAFIFKACWDEELKLAMMISQNYGVRIVEDNKCGLQMEGRFERAMNDTFIKVFVEQKAVNDFVEMDSSFYEWISQGEASDPKNEPTFCCNCGIKNVLGMAIDAPSLLSAFDESMIYNSDNLNGTIGAALAPGDFSFLGGSGLVIPKKSRNPFLAWGFILFMINGSNPRSCVNRIADITFSVPPYESALESAQWNLPKVEVVRRQIQRAVPIQYPLQTFPQFSSLESLKPIRHLWLNVLYKNMSLSHSINRACDLIDFVFQPECTSSDMDFNVSDCDTLGNRVINYYWKLPRTCKGDGDLPDSIVLTECPYIVWRGDASVALIVVASMLIVATLVVGILLISMREEPIVRLANVPLSMVVLLGGLLCYASIILSIGPGIYSCILPTWFIAIGFLFVFGSFDLKMYRLWRIFNASVLVRVSITDTDLFRYLGILVTIEVALLLLWTFLPDSPLSSGQRYVERQSLNVLEFYCERGQTIPIVLLLVYNGVIFGGGVYFSFDLRNAPSDFKDRQFVTVSMSVLGFGAVVLIPASLLLTSRVVSFLLVSLGVLIITTFTLGMYTIPKLLHGFGLLKIDDELSNFINRKNMVPCPVCKKPMKTGIETSTTSSIQ